MMYDKDEDKFDLINPDKLYACVHQKRAGL